HRRSGTTRKQRTQTYGPFDTTVNTRSDDHETISLAGGIGWGIDFGRLLFDGKRRRLGARRMAGRIRWSLSRWLGRRVFRLSRLRVRLLSIRRIGVLCQPAVRHWHRLGLWIRLPRSVLPVRLGRLSAGLLRLVGHST